MACMLKDLCASVLHSTTTPDTENEDVYSSGNDERGDDMKEEQETCFVKTGTIDESIEDGEPSARQSPIHKTISSENVAKVVLARVKKLEVDAKGKKLKFKTVKTFWRLRNKIFLEGKKLEEKESTSPEVIITEVTPSAKPSAREQRASSRKSIKKMARNIQKGKIEAR